MIRKKSHCHKHQDSVVYKIIKKKLFLQNIYRTFSVKSRKDMKHGIGASLNNCLTHYCALGARHWGDNISDTGYMFNKIFVLATWYNNNNWLNAWNIYKPRLYGKSPLEPIRLCSRWAIQEVEVEVEEVEREEDTLNNAVCSPSNVNVFLRHFTTNHATLEGQLM